MNIPSHKLPSRIERADFARSSYFMLAPPGTTPEEIVDPDYWTHLARNLRINDRIEIVAADGSFDMEVRVTSIDPRALWAHVRPLRIAEGKHAIPEAAGANPDKDGYLVEWGGAHRWRIIRGQDVVARDFATQTDAIEALMNIKAAKRGEPIPLVPRMSDPKPPEPEPAPEPGTEAPPVEEPPPDGDDPAAKSRTSTGQFAKTKAA